MMNKAAAFILFLTISLTSFGQIEDSTVVENKRKKKEFVIDTSYHHSVKRAVILSTLLPGAGQVYNEIGHRKYNGKKNRSWWKVPLIYGGLVTTLYYFNFNLDTSNLLKKEIRYRQETGNPYFHKEYEFEGTNSLIGTTGTDGFNLFAGRRDLFIFLTLGVYGLNVIEALVDAHFVTFDVSEDLSFYWRPTLYGRNSAGLNVGIRF